MKPAAGYMSDDNKFFWSRTACLKHEAEVKGLKHECPKCKGGSVIARETLFRKVLDEEAMGYAGWGSGNIYKDVPYSGEEIPCVVCNGAGYTAVEKKPILSQPTVVGYN